ncbi:hypothetical protein [Halorubrum pallidum]
MSYRPYPDAVLRSTRQVTFDHAEFLGVLFEKLRGKQCSEPTHNPR